MATTIHQLVAKPLLRAARSQRKRDFGYARHLPSASKRQLLSLCAQASSPPVARESQVQSRRTRSSVIGDMNLWPQNIPYTLSDNLEINAKGVILRAFERYRLKTCINFHPWNGEYNYIQFYKGEGCHSPVGNRHKGKQRISIGYTCDKIGSVQHEILHTLGFVHEHSRSDRDDYITVMENNIIPGTEAYFKSYSDKKIDSLNIPYDYTSLTHYSKNAYPKGLSPTIVTKDPYFMDVIGQRMDFSAFDVKRVNQRYNCSSSLTFMDSCDFERENICGMIQSSEDNGDWQRVSQVPGGPDTDQTYLDMCIGSCFFMYFNSSSVNIGEKAILESRLFYPKRKFQCLQFFYYNSGNKNDKLRIYIRQYFTGHHQVSLNLMGEVKDVPTGSWQLYHVSLAATSKFRVVFEGTRGTGPSAGGISIDDINLSETWCPHHIWRISNFKKILNSKGIIYSPPFYSPAGYAFQVALDVRTHNCAGIYFSLISGANDKKLQWPCAWQQATMTLLDQNPDIRRRMSHEKSVTTDPFKTLDNDDEVYFWDTPYKVGVEATFPNGTLYYRSRGFGTSTYITHKWLQSRDFIRGDNVYFLLTVEDISYLLVTEPSLRPTEALVQPPINPCANFTCQNDGICVTRKDKAECRCYAGKDWWFKGEKCEMMDSTKHITMVTVLYTTAVFIFMLIVILLTIHFSMKIYSKKGNKKISNNWVVLGGEEVAGGEGFGKR
ncbi:meprin A subunit beta-like [Macrotis lagotis]|uniref:meprin A subunit beta-like n=1 Tax=Macrotis lagotis TaxID=92651 RepID=UPI003D6963FC